MDPSAAVLILGDEVLSGEVPDENATYLSRRLWEAGVSVARITFLPDRRDVIAREVAALSPAFTYVFVTGGIGPTHDDRTRAAVAEGLGRGLALHGEAEAFLGRSYGETLTEADAAMAELPEGAALLYGTHRAFGFRVENVYVFPGVPFLLRDIFERLFPALRAVPYHVRELWTDSKEGLFSRSLEQVQERFPAVRIGSYPTSVAGRYRSRIVLRCRDESDLAACEDAVSQLLRVLGQPSGGR
ncbi:MAG: competence/damage-inducible protein A [Gemmatimonadota bacterium]